MPYIGKSPEMGVRTRYYYTVSAGATSVSGSDDNSKTLTFSDGEFVDVSLNGVALVAGTDYNTTTANTIAGLSAMSANDVVEVVVYDVFSVFSGDISGDLAVGGNSTVTGTTTLTGALSAKGGAVFNEDSADVDFRVESNGNANMLFVDGGNDAVGIGNNNPADYGSLIDNLVIGTTSGNNGMTIVSGTDSGGRICFADNTASPQRGMIEYSHGSDDMLLNANGATRITIGSGGDIDVETGDIFFSTAGKGIVLGATSNTDANTLDDYEEGTWTPRLGGSSAGVATPGSNNNGYYTKVGRVVHVTGFLVWSEITTSISGDVQLQGLPFTVANLTGNSPSQPITRMFNGFTNGSSIPHAFHAAPNTTVAVVIGFSGQGGSNQNWTNSITASASGNIYDINLTYITSD